MDKTKEQLEAENLVLQAKIEERKISDTLYAIKLVEKIVFGLVGFVLLSVLAAIIGLVVLK